jgi:hypothetical protein
MGKLARTEISSALASDQIQIALPERYTKYSRYHVVGRQSHWGPMSLCGYTLAPNTIRLELQDVYVDMVAACNNCGKVVRQWMKTKS